MSLPKSFNRTTRLHPGLTPGGQTHEETRFVEKAQVLVQVYDLDPRSGFLPIVCDDGQSGGHQGKTNVWRSLRGSPSVPDQTRDPSHFYYPRNRRNNNY
ncbi:hypothetical protein RUM43_004979 [Polyplax serrata]|uniref:Uncharacterized protein n=1 Tax=Polyplax serrata TaxID=468196 RepID=A0AAN8SCU1_POLSC